MWAGLRSRAHLQRAARSNNGRQAIVPREVHSQHEIMWCDSGVFIARAVSSGTSRCSTGPLRVRELRGVSPTNATALLGRSPRLHRLFHGRGRRRRSTCHESRAPRRPARVGLIGMVSAERLRRGQRVNQRRRHLRWHIMAMLAIAKVTRQPELGAAATAASWTSFIGAYGALRAFSELLLHGTRATRLVCRRGARRVLAVTTQAP